MNIIRQNLLKSSGEETILKEKYKIKSMFDKSLSQSISVDNKKNLMSK